MRKQIVSALMASVAAMGYTQELPEIIPPAPEARKMIEYGNVPVSYNTGVSNINVPLYTLQTGSLVLPISLSYHTGGVKVMDADGIAGLKWSLANGSGSIDRTVKGRPDENTANPVSGWFQTSQNMPDLDAPGQIDKINIKNGCFDVQPDEFLISLPNGESTKFTFDQNRNIVFIPDSKNMKVDFFNDYTLRSGFKVTDISGTQYVFDVEELNTVEVVNGGFSNPCPIRNYISSWKLSKIILPSNAGEVNYSYSNDTYRESYVTSQSKVIQEPVVPNLFYSDWGIKTSNTTNTYRLKLLNTITYKNRKVEFVYVNKGDTDDGKRLSTISVYTDNTNRVERYKLYHYFNTHKRMFLTKVTKVSKNNKEQDYRAFEYENRHLLPEKGNFGIDHFGYFNGASNSTLIPSGYHRHYSEYRNVVLYTNYRGANRDLNTQRINTGNLTKVIYPTKGWSSFIYEPNDAVENSSEVETLENFSFNAVQKDSPSGWQTTTSGLINAPKGDAILTLLNASSFDGPSGPGGLGGFVRPKLEILDNNNRVIKTYGINSGQNLPNGQIIALDPVLKQFKLRLLIYNRQGFTVSAQVAGQYPVTSTIPKSNKYYGGVRIKSVENYDNSNTLIGKTTYNYHDFTNPSLTSGFVFGKQSSYADEITIVQRPDIISQDVSQKFLKLSSYTLQNISYSRGAPVLYQNVEEVFEGTNASYKNRYYYKNYGLNITGTKTGTIYHDYILEDYANGILYKKESYDRNNKKVSQEEYEYSFLRTDNRVHNDRIHCRQDHQYAPTKCTAVLRDRVVSWFVPWKTISTLYYDTKEVQTITEAKYDNPNHRLPTQQLVTNSKGETIITKTKYAHDVNNTRLLTDHRIAEPLQVETTQKAGSSISKLSTLNTVYKDFGAGVYQPYQIQNAKGTDGVKERIVYHDYDDYGNPKEVSKMNGSKIYYVWGYMGTQPIAKIEGYTTMNSTQLSAINAAIIASDADKSVTTEDTLRTRLTTLRNAFANTPAQVTTFTYDPLIGVTSTTDPRGYTMYYSYDEFNRLHLVKDQDGNITQENKYQYKN